ncbi:MAG: GNAT family N-acetyltransferase [Candidatus Diapherotrites archaeon]|uniref:GNAT family N-acetyltransferase n=1 Tax=Candidatus Iainarchaeum sp. TaxID=3101447 RepID=A0A8T4L4H6_9ARCH|nr:GNAT family N-acetyltransferase [Candidatus Diapherotrites archaeon]
MKNIPSARSVIEFRFIAQVPPTLVDKFMKDTYAPLKYHTLIKNSDRVLGAFHNEQMIGFISANGHQVTALYVEPQYRRLKIGSRLIRRLGTTLRKNGFDGFHLAEMTGYAQVTVKKESERLAMRKKMGTGKEIRIYPSGIGFRGDIRFPRKTPRK